MVNWNIINTTLTALALIVAVYFGFQNSELTKENTRLQEEGNKLQEKANELQEENSELKQQIQIISNNQQGGFTGIANFGKLPWVLTQEGINAIDGYLREKNAIGACITSLQDAEAYNLASQIKTALEEREWEVGEISIIGTTPFYGVHVDSGRFPCSSENYISILVGASPPNSPITL